METLIYNFDAEEFFSPNEMGFLKDEDPDESDVINFSRQYECYWVTLWALGYIDKLEYPNTICDVSKASSFLEEA